jgi:hypothetical protein
MTTATTIITFLKVFLIQPTQNIDSRAVVLRFQTCQVMQKAVDLLPCPIILDLPDSPWYDSDSARSMPSESCPPTGSALR